MTTMNKRQDPYKVQLADIANEVGGNMAIKYYTLDFTLTKEQLQDMKKNGLKTDMMSCIFAALIMNGMNETEVKEYIEKGPQCRGCSQRDIRGSRRWGAQCNAT